MEIKKANDGVENRVAGRRERGVRRDGRRKVREHKGIDRCNNRVDR